MSLNQQTYQLSNQVLFVAMQGEHVLMDYASGKYFGIRGAMQILLEPMKEGVTFSAMTALLCSHYGITADVAERDLHAILPRLLDAGIVQIKSS